MNKSPSKANQYPSLEFLHGCWRRKKKFLPALHVNLHKQNLELGAAISPSYKVQVCQWREATQKRTT